MLTEANRSTIYDVADRAGVSTATVSKVLNNGHGVKPSTARAVRKAMAELAYVPPPPGQRRGYRRPQRKRHTGRLALVIPGMKRSVLQAPVYMEVQRGIERATREQGQALLFSHIPHGEPLPTQLVRNKVDGIVVFGDPDDSELPRELHKLPLVRVMGAVHPLAGYDHVTYDNDGVGRLAAEYLISRGHRHCGFVGDLAPNSIYGERGASFQRRLMQVGGAVAAASTPSISIITEQIHQVDRVRMRETLDRLLTSRPRPTALFFPADMLTNAAYPLLHERGVIPGRDLDIVSCNNEALLLANLHPRPAVVDIHAETVGYKAVEQLLWRIDHPKDTRVTSLIGPELIEGQRDARPRANAGSGEETP